MSDHDSDLDEQVAEGGSKRVIKRWTQEEHAKLAELVAKQQASGTTEICWAHIARELPGRTGKQCRHRWVNSCQPYHKRGAWDLEEEEIVAQLHAVHGSAWSHIASKLNGRSENSVKNHYNALFRSKYLDSKKESVLANYVKLLRDGYPQCQETYDQALAITQHFRDTSVPHTRRTTAADAKPTPQVSDGSGIMHAVAKSTAGSTLHGQLSNATAEMTYSQNSDGQGTGVMGQPGIDMVQNSGIQLQDSTIVLLAELAQNVGLDWNSIQLNAAGGSSTMPSCSPTEPVVAGQLQQDNYTAASQAAVHNLQGWLANPQLAPVSTGSPAVYTRVDAGPYSMQHVPTAHLVQTSASAPLQQVVGIRSGDLHGQYALQMPLTATAQDGSTPLYRAEMFNQLGALRLGSTCLSQQFPADINALQGQPTTYSTSHGTLVTTTVEVTATQPAFTVCAAGTMPAMNEQLLQQSSQQDMTQRYFLGTLQPSNTGIVQTRSQSPTRGSSLLSMVMEASHNNNNNNNNNNSNSNRDGLLKSGVITLERADSVNTAAGSGCSNQQPGSSQGISKPTVGSRRSYAEVYDCLVNDHYPVDGTAAGPDGVAATPADIYHSAGHLPSNNGTGLRGTSGNLFVNGYKRSSTDRSSGLLQQASGLTSDQAARGGNSRRGSVSEYGAESVGVLYGGSSNGLAMLGSGNELATGTARQANGTLPQTSCSSVMSLSQTTGDVPKSWGRTRDAVFLPSGWLPPKDVDNIEDSMGLQTDVPEAVMYTGPRAPRAMRNANMGTRLASLLNSGRDDYMLNRSDIPAKMENRRDSCSAPCSMHIAPAPVEQLHSAAQRRRHSVCTDVPDLAAFLPGAAQHSTMSVFPRGMGETWSQGGSLQMTMGATKGTGARRAGGHRLRRRSTDNLILGEGQYSSLLTGDMMVDTSQQTTEDGNTNLPQTEPSEDPIPTLASAVLTDLSARNMQLPTYSENPNPRVNLAASGQPQILYALPNTTVLPMQRFTDPGQSSNLLTTVTTGLVYNSAVNATANSSSPTATADHTDQPVVPEIAAVRASWLVSDPGTGNEQISEVPPELLRDLSLGRQQDSLLQCLTNDSSMSRQMDSLLHTLQRDSSMGRQMDSLLQTLPRDSSMGRQMDSLLQTLPRDSSMGRQMDSILQGLPHDSSFGRQHDDLLGSIQSADMYNLLLPPPDPPTDDALPTQPALQQPLIQDEEQATVPQIAVDGESSVFSASHAYAALSESQQRLKQEYVQDTANSATGPVGVANDAVIAPVKEQGSAGAVQTSMSLNSLLLAQISENALYTNLGQTVGVEGGTDWLQDPK